ncbi:di-heme oxidoredictase family protein [Dokdonella sp.]|uniref:di-heme oxidoredictase family protein n=1 Tax=Dokdonella sp. TaxID=2291710 RepID=UPI003C56F57F
MRILLLLVAFSAFGVEVATAADQVPSRRHRADPSAQHVRPGGGEPGDPLPGLTEEQLADFAAGKDEFLNVEDAEGGLGPIFNGSSCVSCHSAPATGGASDTLVTRFGLSDGELFDPLADLGGSLLQALAIDPLAQELVPDIADVVINRESTPLFGLGLVEAIPDNLIIANARRQKRHGIGGRVAMVEDLANGGNRVGRFGWKAQLATLLDFSADAYVNEMGITSRIFPEENAPNGNQELLAQFDAIMDPEDEIDAETGKGDIDHATDFMRFLAPPPRRPMGGSARAGERQFERVGCADCHTPAFRTGSNPIAALHRKPVALYSDLLLHDMGSLADGIAQGAAGPGEMKTAPLWGLRESGPYLHDGRAETVDAAIRGHEGEAARVRDGYARLSDRDRQQLLEFLDTL